MSALTGFSACVLMVGLLGPTVVVVVAVVIEID